MRPLKQSLARHLPRAPVADLRSSHSAYWGAQAGSAKGAGPRGGKVEERHVALAAAHVFLNDRFHFVKAFALDVGQEGGFEFADADVLEKGYGAGGFGGEHKSFKDMPDEVWREVIKGQTADDVVKIAFRAHFFYGAVVDGHLVGVRGEGLVIKEPLFQVADEAGIYFA